jgi:hypothetical protein
MPEQESKFDQWGVVLNTPLVTELADGVQAKADTVSIDDTVDELIDALLGEAEKYYKGQRGQVEMDLKAPKEKTANEKAADEKMAEASVASTRKPRGSRSPVAGTIPTSPVVQ